MSSMTIDELKAEQEVDYRRDNRPLRRYYIMQPSFNTTELNIMGVSPEYFVRINDKV